MPFQRPGFAFRVARYDEHCLLGGDSQESLNFAVGEGRVNALPTPHRADPRALFQFRINGGVFEVHGEQRFSDRRRYPYLVNRERQVICASHAAQEEKSGQGR